MISACLSNSSRIASGFEYRGVWWPDSLDKILDNALTAWEEQYGTGASETTLALRFKGIVQRAVEQTGHRVAILVDEYDKPMLQAIGNEEFLENG